MTQASARNFTEAPERDDPRNAVLDLVEAALRTAIEHGLEPQLRAKLAALLPPVKPERDLFSAPGDSPAGSRPPGAGPVGADDEIKLVALVRACIGFARIKADALAHAGVALIKARAESELAAAKKARGA